MVDDVMGVDLGGQASMPAQGQSAEPADTQVASEQMTWDEVERAVTEEVRLAIDHQSALSDERTRSWDRYRGRPLGNEIPGRSQYVSRDAAEKVLWLMPHLLQTFAVGDPKIKLQIVGQPPWVGEALMDMIVQDVTNGQPSLYLTCSDWFGDALVSGTAFTKVGWNIEWKKTPQMLQVVDQRTMQGLLSDPRVQVVSYGQEQQTPTGLVWYGVRVMVQQQVSDSAYIEAIPPWEVAWHPLSREVDDEHAKGHVTTVTLDYLRRINLAYSDGGEDYFWGLDRLDKSGAKTSGADLAPRTMEAATLASERSTYYDAETWVSTSDYSESGPKRTLELVEWYTRLDLDGDGMLEDVTAWLADGVMIRAEANEEGFVPLCRCSAIRDPYRFEGRSLVDLLSDLQLLKTMMTRQLIDNAAFANSGRWLVDPAGNVDITRLMQSIPGDVVYGRPDSVQPLIPPIMPLAPQLQLLEYIDSVSENRSGVTRYNQGLDADSLNKTATGVTRIQEAGKVRLHAIAAMIAEDALKGMYRKLAWLYQQHLSGPRMVSVHGQQVQVTREMIQGKVVAVADLGLSAILEEGEIRRLDRATQLLMGLQQRWPGLLSPQGVHALATQYLDTLGIQPDQFIAPANEFMTQFQQQQQQEQQQQQLQQQVAMTKLAADQRQAEIDSLRRFVAALVGQDPTNRSALMLLSGVDPASVITHQGPGGAPTVIPNALTGMAGGGTPPDLVAQILAARQGGIPNGQQAGGPPTGRPNVPQGRAIAPPAAAGPGAGIGGRPGGQAPIGVPVGQALVGYGA